MAKLFRLLVLAGIVTAVTGQYAAAQTTVIDLARDGADQIWRGTTAGSAAGLFLDQGAVGHGDTRRDLIVGAPGGPGVLGHVYIIFGGPVRSGNLSFANADATLTGAAENDLFGFSTAAGNIVTLEDSGPRDLAVGAPNAFGGKGAVYIFRGALPLASNTNAASAVMRVIGAPGDRIGTTLASGDMNGDGYREVIIGAPGSSRIYVIAGGPSLSGTVDLSSASPLFSFAAPGIGQVLAAGDITGDNISEIIIGSPSNNAVHVIRGRAALPYPATADMTFTGADAGDAAGTSLRILDVDADGKRDLAIGAPGADGPSNARTNAGEVYLLFGSSALASRSLAVADVTIYGSAAGMQTGSFMTAGDINRDIPNDIVVSAPTSPTGRSELHIYYGRARSRMGTAVDGRRLVDLAVDGQIDRWILSDSTVGLIAAAQVFEVTGEGARDIIAGVPSADANTGAVHFTISPKMRLDKTSLSLIVNEGGTVSAPVKVLNRSAVWITWGATGNRSWLTGSPASGSASNTLDGTVNVTANSAGLAPGVHTGSLSIASTEDDLTMSINVAVTLTVTAARVAIDTPNAATTTQPFNVAGWAVDLAASTGTGISEVHVYAYPNPGSGQAPIFLGFAAYGGARGDIGALFGARFTNSGYNLTVSSLRAGTTYQIVAFVKSTVSNTIANAAVRNVTITASGNEPQPDPDPDPDPNPNPNPNPPTFAIDRARLTYGAIRSNGTLTHKTQSQMVMLSQTGGGTMNWTVSTSHPWIAVSPASGTGSAALTVTVADVSLPNLGTFDGTIVVSSAEASTPAQTIAVRLRLTAPGTTAAPVGVIDTPTDNSVNVVGAIPVTGWAIDDIDVVKVEIFRDPVNGEPVHPNGKVYIGDAAFVAGARPDVESLNPELPLNYRAGWGYLLLTNVLPDIGAGKTSGGNGTFRLHAYATDSEGNTVYLGGKRFTANNAAATKPFGTLDTPSQGGTISGASYVSFGWALSPSAPIPTNGSTITVYIDGVAMGHPVYNQFRSDIAGAFPTMANANGAIGYFIFDTRQLSNGVHTIGWLASDSAGNAEGLGSRFFTVFNGANGSAVTSATTATSGAAIGGAVGQKTATIADVPPDHNLVEVRKAFAQEATLVVPESAGAIGVESKELEQVELRLANDFSDGIPATYEGYLVVNGEMRPLPIGSTLDTNAGVFSWQPGAGFVGTYEFVFLRSLPGGAKTKIPATIRIAPKFERETGRRER